MRVRGRSYTNRPRNCITWMLKHRDWNHLTDNSCKDNKSINIGIGIGVRGVTSFHSDICCIRLIR
uniref:Uncharacterized protein n=1 Tax=Utricularia reniformis TaxID=192314 RepID=A0A1Y0B1M3_9LAMI|nr:hypothetical protein AEK19_MT1055 [Utricularia reniformis]ART31278.1 hypothetical protein AEK19_MT1055 [Utricularia reniformis]